MLTDRRAGSDREVPRQIRQMNGERTNTATREGRGRRRFPAHTTAEPARALFPASKRERSERYSPVPVPRFARARPDRPGPRSQSFFRRYGSILPTSLTYIDAIDERLYTLETCCGWWVRTGSRAAKTGPGFSRAAESAPDAARAAALYRYLFRISGRADSTDMVLYEEERTLPGAPGDVSGLACVTAVSPEKRRAPPKRCRHPRALSESGFGNINPIPFRREAGRSIVRRFRVVEETTLDCRFSLRIRRLSGRLSPAS